MRKAYNNDPTLSHAALLKRCLSYFVFFMPYDAEFLLPWKVYILLFRTGGLRISSMSFSFACQIRHMFAF
jgi:hypothetical protein